MKCISKNCKLNINKKAFEEAEEKYSITIREDIKEFLKKNSGGRPEKDLIVSKGKEFEVRVFMSLDSSYKYYYIQKPLDYFLKKTNGKIIPIGIDSGDNYYCVNNETGKVYYWNHEDDSYYCIAGSLNEYVKLFDSDGKQTIKTECAEMSSTQKMAMLLIEAAQILFDN